MTTATLADKHCVPCKGGIPAIKGHALKELQQKISDQWQVVDGHHLEREFKFRNFREALTFTNKVGELSDEQDHHPTIQLSYGKVKVTYYTHAADGLTENDFIMAAKIDEMT